MFQHENGRELTEEDLRLNVSRICDELKQASLDQGIALSEPPDILFGDGTNYRLLNPRRLTQ